MPLTNLRKSLGIAAVLAGTVVLVFGTTGCSLMQKSYSPRTLPAQFHTQTIRSAQSLDVSRFAGLQADAETIHRGDLLKVSLAAGLDADAVADFYVRVGDNGIGSLPEVGSLQLAGLNYMQAEQQITEVCVRRGLYRQPLVTVSVEEERVNRITVAGAVEKPGVQELPWRSSYLMDAIIAAGWFSKDASTTVAIRRPAGPSRLAGTKPPGVQLASNMEEMPGRRAELVCLDLSAENGQVSRGEYLSDGTVVTVKKLEPEPIQVVGLVRKPGQYEIPYDYDLNIFSAIALAGGLSSKLANDVVVLRKDPDGAEQAVIKVSLSAAKKRMEDNLQLGPGDIVSVEPNAGTFMIDVLRILRFGIGSSLPLF